jgi:hypothetical protein
MSRKIRIWHRPKLIVLTRGIESDVLTYCKHGVGGSGQGIATNPSLQFNACKTSRYNQSSGKWTICFADCVTLLFS